MLSVVRRLASLWLSGISCSGGSVLADKRLRSGTTFALSCLLSHARNSAVTEESRSVYDSKADICGPAVIKSALRLRVARGHPGTRTYTYRGHVEYDTKGGSPQLFARHPRYAEQEDDFD